MDRDAIARRRRRGQVLEALTFEQEREAALRDQLEEVVLEQEGPRVDAEAFAQMQPDDVAVVRELLDDGWSLLDDEDDDDLADDDDALNVAEDEVERLQGEIESCRTRQRAFERYLEALESPPAEAAEG